MKKMKEAERMINCTVDFRCRPVSFGDAMFIAAHPAAEKRQGLWE
jgi:hypothetical protein